MRKFTLELDVEEARRLLTCLVHPDPKGKDLDLQLEIEDLLVDYLKQNEDDR